MVPDAIQQIFAYLLNKSSQMCQDIRLRKLGLKVKKWVTK